MEQDMLPTLFDEVQLTTEERVFLDNQDFRMRSVGQQFKLEVGRIVKETHDWFRANHKRGCEEWIYKKWGISRQYQQYLIDAFEGLKDQNFSQLGLSLSAQLELKEAPNEQSAIDEVKIRQELEEKITAKKAKEIATYQQAKKIAEDKARSEEDRATAIEQQLAYVKRQLEQAQKASQEQKVVEKRVEVTPQKVLDRQRQLEDRVRQLQHEYAKAQKQSEQIKRERDLYKRDLDKERQDGNAAFLRNLEPDREARLRANFAEAMREVVAWCVASRMKLPSVVDTQVFEAEEWHRLEEAIQAHDLLGRELRNIKNAVSSRPSQQAQLFIVDGSVAL